MSKDQLMNGLNEQLNREITTFLRYMLQAAAIKGVQFARVRELYAAEVADEVGHAQYLADQIVMLGGTPRLAPDLTAPPKGVEAMLERDAKEERTDVENYMRLASLAEVAGLHALKLRMEQHAADEDEHGHEMRRLLG